MNSSEQKKSWHDLLFPASLGIFVFSVFIYVFTFFHHPEVTIKQIPGQSCSSANHAKKPGGGSGSNNNSKHSPLDKENEEEQGISFPIDINKAGELELSALPAIGEVRAADIVKYRESHGPFKSKDEIKKVKGIGDGIYQEIKDLITAK